MLEVLMKGGFALLAKAGLVKGKEWIREQTGVDLDKGELTSEDQVKLKEYETRNEQELYRIWAENEASQMHELTARHSQDMASDSWLSKNVRPIVLVTVTVFVGVALALPVSYVGEGRFDAVTNLALWVYGFYFGARSVFDKGSLANVVGKLRK